MRPFKLGVSPILFPLGFLFILFILLTGHVSAADQVVTNNNDSGSGSLRQAIADIQSSGNSGDTITFNLSAGNETITLSSQIPLIWQKGMIIDGDNTAGSGTNVTVQVTTPGTSTYRIFEIRPYSTTFTFKNMTMKGGTVGNSMGGTIKIYSGDSSGNVVLQNVIISHGKSDYGGCVYAWGTMGSLTITNSTFQNCEGTSTSYGGGAVFMRSLSGSITISDSTFDTNTTAGSGGALHIFDETFSITNSTFSNNNATNSGGALYLDGDNALATATITNSTFNNNTGNGSPGNDFGGAMYFYYGKVAITNSTIFQNSSQIGGGVAFSYGTIYLTNTTIAENTTTAIAGGLYQGSSTTLYIKNTILANNGTDDYYAGGTVYDNGYNIIEVSNGRTWNGTGDITGNQANLNLSSTLGTNSTLTGTRTLSLSSGSVAVDAGASGTNSTISVPSTDQRGLSRSGTYDIGAFEYGATTNNVPVLGYSTDNVLGTPSHSTDGSGYITIPFRVQDGDGESVTTTGWQYSDDGGNSWNSLTASDLTGEDGSKTTTTDWSGTVYNIIWHSQNQLNNTTQNDIRFRFKVNDGTDDSAYGTTANFIVDNAGPIASSYTPTDNATSVSTSTNLVLDLNEPADAETGNIEIRKSSDNSLVETIGVTSGKVTGSGTSQITINPDSTLSDNTEYYVLIDSTALDDSYSNSYAGISSATTWSFTTGDFSNPAVSNITASPGDISATITWTTDEASSSQVEYGLLSSYGSSTAESDTSPRVTSHSVTLSSLQTCRRYYYRVLSTDSSSNQITSAQQTFSTTGCPVSTIVSGTESAITTASGGEFQLTNNSSIAKLTVPDGFASENADFQINKLDVNSVPDAPSGTSLADENIFDLSAVSASNNDLTSFDKDITFTVIYGSTTESQFVENTLDIYRYNDGTGSWDKKNCILDTVTNTLTCSISSFSTYGLFGETQQSSAGSSSSSNSIDSSSECTSPAPEYAPHLFQIDTTDTTATLFFTPILHTNEYFISFSTHAEAEEHGALISLGSDGVQSYTVELLAPQTVYFFKVRGQRGCTPGEWSGIYQATTSASQKSQHYYKHTTSLKKAPQNQITQKSDVKAVAKKRAVVSPSPTPMIEITASPQKENKNCFLFWCW